MIQKLASYAKFRYSETLVKGCVSVFRNFFRCYAFRMPKELADTLRDAIRKSEIPLLTLAKATGVAVSTLSEFMDGADMRLRNASKVAAFLKLELRPRKR